MSKYGEYILARQAGLSHDDACEYADFKREFVLPEFPTCGEVADEIEKIAPATLFSCQPLRRQPWYGIYAMLRHKLPYPPVVAQVILSSIAPVGRSRFVNGELRGDWQAPVLDEQKYEQVLQALAHAAPHAADAAKEVTSEANTAHKNSETGRLSSSMMGRNRGNHR